MNFTREPIIETVITPREGCKLVVRSSRGGGQEDYYVDAVEVVSFGRSFFFRSLERPKSFLLPVSDYEILELRETRMVLKSVSSERSIKIGGGREAPPRSREHPPQEERARSEEETPSEEGMQENQPMMERTDRKRDRRRRGRRGGRDRGEPREPRSQPHPEESQPTTAFTPETEGPELAEGSVPLEEQKAPSFISKLFPPPPTLIKETLGRYKTVETVEETSTGAPEGSHKDRTEEALFDPRLSDDDEIPSRDESEFEE